MTHAADYRVKLDAFEGPMDLLLFLIRRAEVEIAEIPISTITEQYMAYLREGGVESIDIEKAGEFVVMAATLMEIKSRMLMPKVEPEEGEERSGGGRKSEDVGDPRSDLIRQLLAYKKYRDAAGQLQERLTEWESRFPTGRAAYDSKRVSAVISEMADVDIEDLELVDLLSAFARVIDSVDMSRVGEHHVVVDDTPIELHAADLMDRLTREAKAWAERTAAGEGEAEGVREGEVEFSRLFAGRSRGEMIGLFLAMLELVRQRRVGVRQDAANQRIMLVVRTEEQVKQEEAEGRA